MPLVKNFATGEPYELLPGERALQLTSGATVPLYIGIRKGEFLLARPAADPAPTYVLTEEQYVRLQQQLKLQVTYKGWLKDGLLVITDVTTPPEPPPEEEPTPEEAPPEEPTPEVEPTPEEPTPEP